MRMGLRNKQKLYYAVFTDSKTVYKTDSEGNVMYMNIDGELVPIEKGKTPQGYSDLTEFWANIATSGNGEAEPVEYGLDVSKYTAKMILPNNVLPLTESSRIWRNKPTVDEYGLVDGKTADYRIVKIAQNLHYTTYLLDKVVRE